ncbi:hypothetical protein Gotri_019413, partial [Gossypium trilobum]|nr:hypothetical protein [Gossypium trilobum]
MHQSDKVLWQFGFRQSIPVAPEMLDAAIQSPGPARAPIQSPDPAVQPTISTVQPFQIMPGAVDCRCICPASHERSQEEPSGSSSFYQSPSPYGFQTASPLVMQTPTQSLFYQSGLSSQHEQQDTLPEKPGSPPEQPQPPLE